MKLAPFIETNKCCRTCGRAGTRWGRRNRKQVMVAAFWVSFVAWFLTIYAACAVSMNPNVLKKAAWVYGDVWHEKSGTRFQTAVGLRGRIDTVDCTRATFGAAGCAKALSNATLFTQVGDGVFERAIHWSDGRSCWSSARREAAQKANAALFDTWDFLKHESFNGDACASCRATATASVTFAIMGAITQIPQMTTDLQRSTLFGDVNCQATMGAVTSFFGTYSTLASLVTFSQSCWRKFDVHPGWVNGGDDAMSWRPGPAFICLVVATLLKLWDAVSHLIVPTPRARHATPKEGLDLAEYLALAVEGSLASEDFGEDSDSDDDDDNDDDDDDDADYDDGKE